MTPPGLREIYYVFSAGTVPTPEIKRAKFEALARQLQNIDEDTGWHALAWYLHWLVNTGTNLGPVVLIHYNTIFSPKLVTAFETALPAGAKACYKAILSNPKTVDRLDTHPLLRYDWMLRLKRADAPTFLASHLLRLMQDYLGLPYVRMALSQETETELWNLVVSRCVSFTQR